MKVVFLLQNTVAAKLIALEGTMFTWMTDPRNASFVTKRKVDDFMDDINRLRVGKYSELRNASEIQDWEAHRADADLLRENARNAYYDFCTRCWPDILVGEWDGDLVGWGACEKADDFITDLWVDPGFQDRGIGTALLEEIEAGIRQRGYPSARLDTHAGNAGAIRLYKRQ